MALTQVNAGDRINASDLNAYYNILKGVAASGESITLIYNAAGSVVLQPSSDPAAGTELIQIKNNAGTVQSALSSDGNIFAGNGGSTLPSLTFESDKDTGFYRVGADEVGLVLGGVIKFDFLSSLTTIVPPVSLSSTLAFSTAASRILPGATSLSLRNNGNTADNILVADAGGVTFRSTADVTLVPTSQVNGRLILFGGGGTPEYISADGGNNGLIGIIARESVFIQIDSDNTGTAGVFAIGHNSTTYDANEIFRVDESGNVTAGVAAGAKVLAAGTLTAGGLLTSAVQVGTSGPLIYSGSGAPSISAAVKGSLYLRSDGTTTNDRAYIATNTSGTWTALTTAA